MYLFRLGSWYEMLKEVHFRLGLSVVPIKKIIEGEKVIIDTIVLVGGGG